MSEMTPDQVALVGQYQRCTLEELYDLIGNLTAEYGDEATRRTYVLGLPNVLERGKTLVEDTRAAICSSRDKLGELVGARRDQLEPILWAGSIADVVLAVAVTHGVPPMAIAVALGKLSNRTIAKLCE